MASRGIVLFVVLSAVLGLSSAASAGTVVESNTVDGNRSLSQQLNVGRFGLIDYHIVAKDPDGLYPYCVTARLERHGKNGWRGIPKSIQTFRHECFKKPSEGESRSETFAAWDTFLYPRKRIWRKVHEGKLRVRGSTDLGGELTLRR